MNPAGPVGYSLVRPAEYVGGDDTDALWRGCVAIADRRRRGDAPMAPHLAGEWSDAARSLFALYRPLLALPSAHPFVIGHLGQSLDGRIATGNGDSCFINGTANLTHLHRLRALCDAVLVGAGTVLADDPQLTTRMVAGPDPTRIVLDPSRRLTARYRVCADPRAPTLVARYEPDGDIGRAQVIVARRSGDGIDLAGLLAELAARGLHAVLVEGGGVTVSRFLQAGLLDRLQIAVAPLIIGSGRPGLQLPEVLRLDECLRPPCQCYPMGDDVLFDLALRPAAPAGPDGRR